MTASNERAWTPMKHTILAIVAICTLTASIAYAAVPMPDPAGPDPSGAAAALIGRLLPKHADQFVCKLIPPDGGKYVFEIESKNGRVILHGNSPLSIAVGLNWYLKYTCHCSISLNGSQSESYPSKPSGDGIELARRLFDKYVETTK
jgi:hypothetical protein